PGEHEEYHPEQTVQPLAVPLVEPREWGHEAVEDVGDRDQDRHAREQDRRDALPDDGDDPCGAVRQDQSNGEHDGADLLHHRGLLFVTASTSTTPGWSASCRCV